MAVRRSPLFFLCLTMALVVCLCFGFGARLALAKTWYVGNNSTLVKSEKKAKVYSSRKAAQKAVKSAIKTKWSKSKVKIKVELAASKKDMNADQRKAYKKHKGLSKRNTLYFITETIPRFSVCAKYRDAHGRSKLYSLEACSGSGGVDTNLSHPLAVNRIGTRKMWMLFAVEKGFGTAVYGVSQQETWTRAETAMSYVHITC